MDKVVGRIEKSMKGCLRPKRDFRLSEIEPTTGSETASINVEIARTIPTSKAERPRTCEKYNNKRAFKAYSLC